MRKLAIKRNGVYLMTTQTLEHFDVLDADLLAKVQGGDWQCTSGVLGGMVYGALTGAGAAIGAAVSAPAAEGGGVGPAAGALLGGTYGAIGGILQGATACE